MNKLQTRANATITCKMQEIYFRFIIAVEISNFIKINKNNKF